MSLQLPQVEWLKRVPVGVVKLVHELDPVQAQRVQEREATAALYLPEGHKAQLVAPATSWYRPGTHPTHAVASATVF